MANYFDTILLDGLNKGKLPNKTKRAREWYRNQAKKLKSVDNEQIFNGWTTKQTILPVPGNMYMYVYDPKLKDILPYYDTFPLTIVIGPAKGGFLGLNMHYLPLPYRARLMDNLYKNITNKNFDETTKINANYELLSRTASLGYFRPCIKHYLQSHLKSKLVYIYPEEWDIALFLPTARFKKATEEEVWADSMFQLGAMYI